MRDDWVRLSTLQHYAYCPRQAALLLDGVWADNHLTVEGIHQHQHVDAGGKDSRRGVRVHHRVQLASERLRIYGVADAIEEHSDGASVPVEHKRGRGSGDLGPSVTQVVAQALCLAEMTGSPVPLGVIYIAKEKKRVPVKVVEHQQAVEEIIVQVRELYEAQFPAITSDRWKCSSCSINATCMPYGKVER